MFNLLYKEIRLVVSPAVYFFSLLSALLLIPSYPYIVGVSYFIFAVQITFEMAKSNKDHTFTSMLPIPRNYVVLSKELTVIYAQVLQLLAALPFALLTSLLLNKNGNIVGMDANIAFFGEALLGYAVFNLIFLPQYFKTGYKAGVPLVLGLCGYLLTVGVFEVLVAAIPTLNAVIDGLNPANAGWQLIVLAVGLILYVGSAFAAYKIASKKFAKVNL